MAGRSLDDLMRAAFEAGRARGADESRPHHYDDPPDRDEAWMAPDYERWRQQFMPEPESEDVVVLPRPGLNDYYWDDQNKQHQRMDG